MKQLNDLEVMKPQGVNMLTQDQRNNALPCLIFLTEKRDDSVKARMCVDGSKQEMDKSEVLAPTISTDELFITLVVDAYEGKDVATIHIPEAFLKTSVKLGNYIKFTGVMLYILCQLNPRLYRQYVVLENGRKLLYTEAHKAVYVMVDSAFFFCLDLSGFL